MPKISYTRASKENRMAVITAPKVSISGLAPAYRYVSVQNGTGVVASSEGVKINFSGHLKRQEPYLLEVRDSSSDTTQNSR